MLAPTLPYTTQEDKTVRLTVMMSKLTANEEGVNKQFKPKYIKIKEEAK